jgi:NAD(P)-dependent dehydrogenase (short-subunit alcohol dehydrogenase family)
MSNLSAESLFRIQTCTVAVVTGGATGETVLSILSRTTDMLSSQGIGLMIARTLSINHAYPVYILGPVAAENDAAVAQSPYPDKPFRTIVCDITSKELLAAAVKQIEGESGYIDLLVANAGVPGPQTGVKALGKTLTPTEYAKLFWDEPMPDFNKPLDVNVTGTFYTILAFLPLLDEGQSMAREFNQTNKSWGKDLMYPTKSHILLTSSTSALSRNLLAFAPAYAMSKAALIHLTKNVSTYAATAGWNIRVNALCPHLVETAFTTGLPFMGDANENGVVKVDKSVNPAGRVLSEEDVAAAVLWVCGKGGEMVDGAVVLVDGGKVGTVPGTY